jgi:hypothetical protein
MLPPGLTAAPYALAPTPIVVTVPDLSETATDLNTVGRTDSVVFQDMRIGVSQDIGIGCRPVSAGVESASVAFRSGAGSLTS